MTEEIDHLNHGIAAMLEERIRQRTEKGYTAEHDRDHKPEELVAAGLCYIEEALFNMTFVDGDVPPFNWPWAADHWKPEASDLENLAKGGALVAAGYDRIVNGINGGY